MRLIVIAVFMLLAGCDRYYGVTRTASVSSIPSHSCVEAALQKTSGISDISYKFSKSNKPLTLSGIKPADQAHYYFYKAGSLKGYIYVETTYTGASSIRQTYRELHSKPSQEEIDLMRPLMGEIEVNIEAACGINGFAKSVVESCSGVSCQPLWPSNKSIKADTVPVPP